MRMSLALAVALSAALTVGGLAVAGDECKKKDGDCCKKKDGDKKDTAKTDGCGGCEKKCDGAAVYALTVKGMTCEGCATAVNEGLSKVDGVAKAGVCHESGTVTISVAPGKNVKISAIEKALGEKFKLDVDAALAGSVKLIIACIDGTAGEKKDEACKGKSCDDCKKSLEAKIAALKAEKTSWSFECAEKRMTVTLALTAKNEVSLKKIRAAFEGDKGMALADVELVGPEKTADECPAKKS